MPPGTMRHRSGAEPAATLGWCVHLRPVRCTSGAQRQRPLRLAAGALRPASSRAHARVLHRAGLLDAGELEQMLAALNQLEADVLGRAFTPTMADEDVHTALERGLVERLGASGRQAAGGAQPERPGGDRPAAVSARSGAGRD